MLHPDVAALIPEMREHLSRLEPHERPISLDNWAAMVDRDYDQFRTAMLHVDPDLLRAYVEHRRNYFRLIEAELRALPDYTIKYTRAIHEKYDITRKDTQRIRHRLGLRCSPKYSRNAEHAMKFIEVGMTLMDIAAASGLTLHQMQGLVSRGHLEPFIELGYAKRLCRNNCMQRVRVVTKIKGKEKPRDRSKSRR